MLQCMIAPNPCAFGEIQAVAAVLGKGICRAQEKANLHFYQPMACGDSQTKNNTGWLEGTSGTERWSFLQGTSSNPLEKVHEAEHLFERSPIASNSFFGSCWKQSFKYFY